MKLIKIFIGLIVTLLLLFFLVRNSSLTSVDLVFQYYDNVPVSLVMLGTLAIGILIGFLIAVTSIISAKNDVRNLKSEMRRINSELDSLRNVAIDEETLEVVED